MPATTTQTDAPRWLESPPVQKSDLTLPGWYEEFQKASWEKFLELPVATKNDESWRYADLKKSRFETLLPVETTEIPSTVGEHAADKRFSDSVAHFVFVNGQLIDSDLGGIPEGVICAPIEEAIANEGERFKPLFDLDAKRLGDEKFAALNGAATKHGVAIYVSGIEVKGSIIVQHYISGDSAPVFPRTIVIAEDKARVSVVESYDSLDEKEPGLSIGVCDLQANEGAEIQHTLVQNLNRSAKQVHLKTATSGKDSTIRSVIANLGGAWIRNESVSQMIADGAHTEIYGANLANGIQEFDQRTLQIHDAQHTTSDLLIKNALYDKCRVIFGGLIQVLAEAHHTDSYQSCRNLLGSDDAEINAMPGLEIDADQVRCSHGATSGQISDEEIFYLRSRGIAPDEARRIVSCGFLHEALEKIPDPDLIEWIAEMIEEKFDEV